ncbi:MAG: adenosylcobinamide-GDP ribazoletransferase [Fusobacteriaceae bacterium]
MNGIISLFKFTTRLPLGGKDDIDWDKLGKSMKFFPLVGIVLGMIMYLSAKILMMNIDSSIVISTLVVIMYVVLTGGIHLDGLSDTFDGIFSYRSKQRMLEIMKDSRVGANGVISLVVYFILSVVLLSELETLGIEMGAVILIYPVLGRMSSALNCAASEYARSSGMAKAFVENTSYKDFIISFTISLAYVFGVIKYFELPISLIMTVPVTAILSYYFARVMKRKIGGVTGDTLGAVLELSQIASILSLYFLV